ncbi:DUF2785 domain-containing protein [Aeromicrobium marinum]|uniref:DUF2785 domain-containing protein n=1 Tax=Aeromicrobium marinum TaxID=219314 RepID=UPI00058EFAC0|nr:DUF2785 domain-containing protein [Aeromicrobium marinum]
MSDEYWKSVKVTGMPVPVDRSLEDSTVELVGMLDHPDPRLRDDLAVSVLTTWIGRGVYDELLHGLGDGLVAGLNHGLGRPEDPTVLRRTSSALLLAEVVNRDTVAQVLDPGTLLAWGDAAAGWLVREQDQRGWSADLGPIQTVANGADLLAALARSRHLGRLELTVLLDVVGDLLLSPTPHVWHHGEDDRVAHAVMTVIHRAVVDRAVVEAWIARLGAGTRPPATRGHASTPWPTPGARNTSATLRALYLQLALGVRGRVDLPGDADLFDRPPHDRADLLLSLLDEIRAESPWLFRTPGST